MVPGLDGVRNRLADVQVFASPRTRRRFLVHLLILVLVLLGLTLVVRRYATLLTDTRELKAFIRGFGFWGPLVLIALQTAQVVVAPVPGQILAVVGGFLYGAWWGTLYNMIGITIGSTVAFWLSRRYGRTYVESIVHADALARFDAIDDDHARIALFFFFLVPGLPDDVLCFAGGLTRIPLWQLVALAIVGRAPSFFLVNVIGDLIGTNHFGAAVLLSAVLVAITAVVYLNREWIIERVTGGE